MNKQSKPFVREDRYVVLKRKHLANLPSALQHRLKPALDEAAQLMPAMECVVVESDWPEHSRVWAMIEARMACAETEDEKDQRRAQAAYNAVISYVLEQGYSEEPMEFLRCWNDGNFGALRREWPGAPMAVYYADPLADHDAIDAHYAKAEAEAV